MESGSRTLSRRSARSRASRAAGVVRGRQPSNPKVASWYEDINFAARRSGSADSLVKRGFRVDQNRYGRRGDDHSARPGGGLAFDADTTPEDRAGRHPAVDPTAVVADLEPLALDGLDQVEIFAAVDLAEHDVTDAE